MYKKLNREEQRIIRESFDTSSPPPPKTTILKNTLWFVLVFFLFVLIGYLVISSGLFWSQGQ